MDDSPNTAMNGNQRSHRRASRQQTALITILTVYWLSMFVGTHLPQIPKALAETSDKGLHFYAYGGLAVLLLSWRLSRNPAMTFRSIALLWLLIGCYAAFDELTQLLVGRHADFGDWDADMGGSAIGLGITWPIASRVLARSDAPR